ncbi:MAG TPA: ribosome silencing factor [Deltaproteobacteria bacterium]|nr:MAG: ribosome silencing factor [Deltaproteobacteria bacterium GWD2_42_10]OGP48061.1 MAG: ribosome silencing factor [Deltaproteobacteria bacterium GWF2_42_12]OGQ37170.1 MAG: ribosome silencing factor [Deltaproteobacteria bacterium RIFCSPLOWO2_02_FULL_42_39]OGQ65818.1 MAG: ribosome silencing factor [Deltaproteobacteria bacterium RIFCSPLOWO2_12_FULL_42_16]HAG49825.1 ribosome silencing factor [Deltaproteobacteria bacterium]
MKGKTKLSSKERALNAAQFALDKKAEGVVILNITDLSSIADYLIICSAASDRQVQAIASSVEEGLKEKGVRPLSTEGIREGHWALLDYGDIIAHVFLEPVREFYNLEGLWPEAPKAELDGMEDAKTLKSKVANL